MLCKVASLSGRWLIDGLLTALRGLRPLVPCYARSRPCRDAGSQTVLSRHCEDFCPLVPCYARSRPYRDAGSLTVLSRHCEGSVLLYRVMHSRVPVGTLAHRPSYHGTARTSSSCTVLCKVASLPGRRLSDSLLTALRGLRPLVPCYARLRPCRDAGSSTVLSRHCEDSVLLYRVMQGRVPDGTLALRQSYHGTARASSSCTVLCKVASLSGRWLIDSLVTALRGLRPLVPCYARSRPCRDAGTQAVVIVHYAIEIQG